MWMLAVVLVASAPRFKVEHAVVASPLAFDASPLFAVRETLAVRCERDLRCAFTGTFVLANPTDAALPIPPIATLRATVASTRVDLCRDVTALPIARNANDSFLSSWVTVRTPIAGEIPAQSECTVTADGTIAPGALGGDSILVPIHVRHGLLAERGAYRYGIRFAGAGALTVDAPHHRVEVSGAFATLRTRTPGFAHGGPFLGYGPSSIEENEEAEELRFRGGWEVAGPTRWLIWSASAETHAGDWVVAPSVEAATPSLFPFVLSPSVSLGIGMPVRVHPAEIGVRGIFGYQFPFLGVFTTVDWFERETRVTTITRLSF